MPANLFRRLQTPQNVTVFTVKPIEILAILGAR